MEGSGSRWVGPPPSGSGSKPGLGSEPMGRPAVWCSTENSGSTVRNARCHTGCRQHCTAVSSAGTHKPRAPARVLHVRRLLATEGPTSTPNNTFENRGDRISRQPCHAGDRACAHAARLSRPCCLESIRVTVTLLQDQSLCQLEDGVSARGQRGSHTNHSLQAFRHLPAVTVMVPSLSRWAGRTVASLCTGT